MAAFAGGWWGYILFFRNEGLIGEGRTARDRRLEKHGRTTGLVIIPKTGVRACERVGYTFEQGAFLLESGNWRSSSVVDDGGCVGRCARGRRAKGGYICRGNKKKKVGGSPVVASPAHTTLYATRPALDRTTAGRGRLFFVGPASGVLDGLWGRHFCTVKGETVEGESGERRATGSSSVCARPGGLDVVGLVGARRGLGGGWGGHESRKLRMVHVGLLNRRFYLEEKLWGSHGSISC